MNSIFDYLRRAEIRTVWYWVLTIIIGGIFISSILRNVQWTRNSAGDPDAQSTMTELQGKMAKDKLIPNSSPNFAERWLGSGSGSQPTSPPPGSTKVELVDEAAVQNSNVKIEERKVKSLEDIRGKEQGLARKKLNESKAVMAETQASFNAYQTKVESIFVGDEGRNLASDKLQTTSFLFLRNEFPFRSRDLSDLNTRLELAESKIDLILTGGESFESISSSLSEIEKKLDEIRKATVGSSTAIEAILESCQSLPRSEVTISELQGKLIADEMLKKAQAAEAVKRAEEDAAARSLAKAEAELATEATRLKEALVRAEKERMEAETKRVEEEHALELTKLKAAEQATKLRKEFEADRRELVQLLAPFVTPADTTLAYDNPTIWFPGTGNAKQPLSLSQIIRVKALEDSPDGYLMLMNIANNVVNNRPKGSFPPVADTSWRRDPAIKSRIVRAQEFLRKYGPIMVEEGLLEP